MKKQNLRRRISLLALSTIVYSNFFSQGTTWNLTGNNNASTSTFVGTTTSQPLIFKTNNTERLRVSQTGQFTILGLGTSGTGFLTTDATGLLQRTSFTGNANQVLLGNGTFGILPVSGYFSLNGLNQLSTPLKFGVGVTLPNEMLEVNGNGVFNGTVTTQGIIIADVAMARDRLMFQNNGMLMEGYNPIDGTRNDIAAISQPLYINSMTTMSQNTIINNGNVGNVGIGTMNPQGKLDVNGITYLRSDLYLPNTTSITAIPDDYSFLILDPTTGKAMKGTTETVKALIYADPYVPSKCDDPAYIFTSPTWANGPNKLFVKCPQVKVGISTDAPRVSLDVQGKSYTSGLAIGDVDPTTNQARVHIKVQTLPNSINKPLLIENADRKLLQLDNTGLLLAREVKLDALAWPDYVFEPTYKLLPLNEVKTYINENKHLPNVPSATEMEANGINVAETNKLLMEKVEELTLYMIQLQEQLEAQKKEIEALKTNH